jgi:hypothetical protein
MLEIWGLAEDSMANSRPAFDTIDPLIDSIDSPECYLPMTSSYGPNMHERKNGMQNGPVYILTNREQILLFDKPIIKQNRFAIEEIGFHVAGWVTELSGRSHYRVNFI